MTECAACGAENTERARFCHSCGSLLGPDLSAVQRKLVTVLFVDVVGSTSLAQAMDAESYRRIMALYFEDMKAVAERHGGMVESFVGDAIVAAFGVPVLHEDDALRAVRAVDEMREVLEELNRDLDARWGLRLETRSGLYTGEVVVGDVIEGHNLQLGDTANTAARLQQAAAPGEVLIGELTYRFVRDAVEVEALEPLDLKGKPAPVAAYRLVRVTPLEQGVKRSLHRPMVGRTKELQTVLDMFDRVAAEETCQLALVVGSPGVGKSRLLGEVASRIEPRARIATGTCLPYGEGITYWPIIDVVKQLADIDDDESPADASRKLSAVVAGSEQRDTITNHLADLLGLGEGSGRSEEIFWAVRKFLEDASKRRPLLVQIEDVHWAQPTLLDLIEHLVDWSRRAGVLIVCTARPEFLSGRPWASQFTTVRLHTLQSEETYRLLANLLDGGEIPDELHAHITAVTGGNPLFVEQTVALLFEEGSLRLDGATWAVTPSKSATPPTIQVLLSSRLDRLDARERRALEAASVVGGSFSRTAVEATLGDGAANVRERLMRLVRKELLEPERWDAPGEETFKFPHALVRDAVYDAIPKQTRADMHERLARRMEQTPPGRLAEHDEIVGFHLEQAFGYRSQLGRLDEPSRLLARRAAEHLALAGRRAQARGDMPAATNLLGRGMALHEVHSPPPLAMLRPYQQALTLTSHLSSAEELLDKAKTYAAVTEERGYEAFALDLEGFLRSRRDKAYHAREGLADAYRLIEIYQDLDDREGLALTWNRLSWLHRVDGAEAKARAAANRTIRYAAEVGDLYSESSGRENLLYALHDGPFAVAELIEEGERCLEWSEARGMKHMEAGVLLLLAAGRAMMDEEDLALTLLKRGRSLLEDLGALNDARVGILGWESFEVAMNTGNVAGAEADLRTCYETFERRGETSVSCSFAARLAEVLHAEGRYDEAKELAREAAEHAPADDLDARIMTKRTEAKLLVREGDLDGAERSARAALAQAQETDWLPVQADASLDLARVLRACGDVEEAEHAAQDAMARYERKGNRSGVRRVRELLNVRGGAAAPSGTWPHRGTDGGA